jgi:thioredoxin-related protein
LVDQFNLNGVPYLFIYDKNGNLRYEHFGYNKGETHFVANITELIESIL